MMRAPAAVAVATFALLTALAVDAHADPVTAEALFRAGRAAMDAGNPKEACARFAESQRLEPAGGTLLNLGECHEALGELASAWQAYVEASELLKDDRRTYALKKRGELEPRLARVELRVEEASDGYEAGIKIGTLQPDLVIMDVMMPKVDGLSLCRSIRENPDTRHIKVLAITAFPEQDNIKKMYDAGADLCLMKPLQFDHFRLEVLRLLDEVSRTQAAHA